MMDRLHGAAHEYVARGIPIFPCREGEKRPATPNGFKDASTDPRQIDEWWTSCPGYNIAFCPDDKGLFVVDLDGAAGENTWRNFELFFIMPPTLRIRTPSGGVHLYYRGRAPSSARRLGPGVDVRGQGGYVLLPPSVVAGVEYAVIAD